MRNRKTSLLMKSQLNPDTSVLIMLTVGQAVCLATSPSTYGGLSILLIILVLALAYTSNLMPWTVVGEILTFWVVTGVIAAIIAGIYSVVF